MYVFTYYDYDAYPLRLVVFTHVCESILDADTAFNQALGIDPAKGSKYGCTVTGKKELVEMSVTERAKKQKLLRDIRESCSVISATTHAYLNDNMVSRFRHIDNEINNIKEMQKELVSMHTD